MSATERKIENLLQRVRDLEAEVIRLRKSSDASVKRSFAEAVLAAPESGDTLPAAITNVSSGTQTLAAGQASALELYVDGGAVKLRPIQNGSGGDKKKVTYHNVAKSAPSLWTSSNEPMLLLRLRDGRWIRIPVSSLSLTQFDFVSGFEFAGGTIKYRTKRLNTDGTVTDQGLTDLITLVCD